jgi:hypothetical protein
VATLLPIVNRNFYGAFLQCPLWCLSADSSNAFNIVNHAVIAEKLTELPVPWIVINWRSSFLADRKIILKYNYVLSHSKVINRGTVQVSGVGPTMYIEHETDLRLISLANSIFKYADDTKVLVPEITVVCPADEFENINKCMG